MTMGRGGTRTRGPRTIRRVAASPRLRVSPSSERGGDLLLAIDVGNTHVTVGVFKGPSLLRTWRLQTNRHATGDELGLLLTGLLRHSARRDDQIKGVVIASVVPALDQPLTHAVRTYLQQVPIVVGVNASLKIKNRYKRPEEVGADRLVNAEAAFDRFGQAAVIVDFGTATTFDCVSARGEYLGGAICPGLELAGEWLATHTAKLPRITFQTAPVRALGQTTKESLQSGLFWGYIGLIEGLLQRLTKEMGGKPMRIVTGGLSTLIGPHLSSVQHILPNLTLDGLRLIWERSRR
jgi:type III pantothenate kinase